ncbi:MAG: putative phage integrase [Variovorax sp.]|nr:putative phage integrase [Variovorax sp.]
MRALAQGVDERVSWDRYLSLEGEHADLRHVRRTIAWIRDQFAAAAKREHRPGTARLILLDPDRFASAPAMPSLSEFAELRGMTDFSEAEQLEAYEEAYPKPGRGGQRGGDGGFGHTSRRARVIQRQLEALRWLQGLVAQDPKPGDSVAAWLNPSMAVRLQRAGLPTLSALVERINAKGARWWVEIPGMGTLKASRVLDWLRANEDLLGLRVALHADKPRAQLTPFELAAVVPAATAIRPYEKFVLPADLNGSAGCHRAPHAKCLLMAANDHEAVGAWLASKKPGSGEGGLSSTQRAYRKEAERLLLWAVLVRRKALSSLALEDATAYGSFLAEPPSSWCGPRYHQRWSPLWRPLEGPLSTIALRQSLIILKSLFAFLVSQSYVTGNPFAAVVVPPNPARLLGSARAFTCAQWDRIDGLLQKHGDDEVQRRLRRAMRWLYATGLRLAEVTTVKCEDLQQVEYRADDGSVAAAWLLSVIGKGGRTRRVPVPAELVDELGDELARHGLERQVEAASNVGIHILARFDAGLEHPVSWSASGLYQAIKAFLAKAAKGLDEADAAQLKKASVHWLRHTYASHALQGRTGRMAVPIQLVQNNLGHASPGTTSMYLPTKRGRADEGDAPVSKRPLT